MATRRDDRRPAAPRPPLRLEDMPAHLRWVDSAHPKYRELHAEQQEWLAVNGWGPMDLVRALLPGGPR